MSIFHQFVDFSSLFGVCQRDFFMAANKSLSTFSRLKIPRNQRAVKDGSQCQRERIVSEGPLWQRWKKTKSEAVTN